MVGVFLNHTLLIVIHENAIGEIRSEIGAGEVVEILCQPHLTPSRAYTFHTLRVGTFNVGTLKGRSGEITEILEWRLVDVCCIQEARRGGSTRFLTGKRHRYKIWVENSDGVGGICKLLVEKLVDKTALLMNVRDLLFVAGDFSAHVGQHPGGFHGVHGGYRFGTHNEEGIKLLEFYDANELMICNTNFKKLTSHLFT
ncbi:uncharacterized protein LOC115226458 [Octopus sinensis]|uniref:Uncharacterized protein LOC115226458 n=1 Tax=Octopus sinensis TaxID=2607531 RepID=A0A6P7TNS9_9MOLL|nr:uncharacterized protein LOC115226458 [Octopus sinensis]